MSERCANCKFFYLESMCRRYPPTMVVDITYDDGPEGGSFTKGAEPYWPEVEPDLWCGEYQPKEKEDE